MTDIVEDPLPPRRGNLSGRVYVAYDYRSSSNIRYGADGIPEPADPSRTGEVLVAGAPDAIGDPSKCEHGIKICLDEACMKTWMLDHTFYWQRTVAGRALRDGASFDVLAHERAMDLNEYRAHQLIKPVRRPGDA